jgi:hypothetical protein
MFCNDNQIKIKALNICITNTDENILKEQIGEIIYEQI